MRYLTFTIDVQAKIKLESRFLANSDVRGCNHVTANGHELTQKHSNCEVQVVIMSFTQGRIKASLHMTMGTWFGNLRG